MSVARGLGLILAGAAACAAPAPAPAPTALRVVTWNIRHARGLDGQVDVERVAAVLRALAPDLVALQEVDVGTRRTGGLDLPAALGERCGLLPVFGRNLEYDGGGYGNAVLSRWPIEAHQNLPYAMLRAGEQRGALQVAVRVGARRVVVVSTHLDYRPDDAERLLNVAELERLVTTWPDAALLVCGDLNAEPGSTTLAAATRQFVDAWDRVGDGGGATYPASGPHKRIDYVLLQADADVVPLAAQVVATDASDHLPLVLDLALR